MTTFPAMTIPAEQQDVAHYLAILSGTLPTETHISAVFIGADTVWKLKKAVRKPFLDFSNPDARQHFLRRELELNQPAAPEIYCDVVAVSRQADGTLTLGGENPIDWVLRMAPVPAGHFHNVIAAKGHLSADLLDALGDCVASYHARLAPAPHVDSANMLLRVTEGNAHSATTIGLPAPEVEAWRQSITTAIAAIRQWLAERSALGCIRRCHGDLHLGNLCLWQGKPVPFDALEFDEAMATIDIGYDLAFLLMDLEHRVGRDAANRVMNRYIARTGDLAMRGLPAFLSQRAMVRAHVLQATRQDGAGYLAAALAYLDPIKPLVVAIGGLQGTGKSTLARALAPELGAAPGAVVLRSDELRKRLHGITPEARLPPNAYTEAGNRATDNALIEQAVVVAKSGHAVVVDATFRDPAVRAELADAVQRARVPFFGFWLQAPLPLLEIRVTARANDASDATVAVLRQAAAQDRGPGEWLAVDASDQAAALHAVRQAIRPHQQDEYPA